MASAASGGSAHRRTIRPDRVRPPRGLRRAAVVRGRARCPRADQCDRVDHHRAAGQRDGAEDPDEIAAQGRAAELLGRQSAAARARFPRHLQRHRPEPVRARPGRRAQRERRAVGRPLAHGAEPQAPGGPPGERRRQRDRRVDGAGGHRPLVDHDRQRDRPLHLRQGRRQRDPRAARHRFPSRQGQRGPHRRRAVRCPDRRRHPPAGPDDRRRLPEGAGARQPSPPPRRRRLRHAGQGRAHLPAGRERPDGDRAQRAVGAQRLPERHAVRRRGQAGPRGSEQAHAGHAPRLPRREAVAELPERRHPCAAAGDRRLHQFEHRGARLGRRQPHAAAEGRALGPGAGHRAAVEEPRHAQERQRDPGRARATSWPRRRSSTSSPSSRSPRSSRCGSRCSSSTTRRPRRSRSFSATTSRRSCPSSAARCPTRGPTSCSCATPHRAWRRSAGSSASSTSRCVRCSSRPASSRPTTASRATSA